MTNIRLFYSGAAVIEEAFKCECHEIDHSITGDLCNDTNLYSPICNALGGFFIVCQLSCFNWTDLCLLTVVAPQDQNKRAAHSGCVTLRKIGQLFTVG